MGAKLRVGPRRARDTHYRHVERARTREPLQRREDLLEREVAGDPEQDERIRALRHEPTFGELTVIPANAGIQP
jgi:hypothetical protein